MKQKLTLYLEEFKVECCSVVNVAQNIHWCESHHTDIAYQHISNLDLQRNSSAITMQTSMQSVSNSS